jgi:hypothetical protein
MKKILIKFAMLLIATLILSTYATSTNSPKIVNIMIATDLPSTSNDEQISKFKSEFLNIANEMNTKKINATIYLTQEAALSDAAMVITNLGLFPNLEYAMSINHTNKTLSNLPYSQQSELLQKTKKITETCHVCGLNTIDAKGFLPQSFDQNEGTYIVLDELGFKYDSGFQAGLLYAPSYESDVWPYKYPNHNFYAVPISTYNLSGEKIFLEDKYLKSKGLSGSQWHDLLVEKFNDPANKGEPMVVLLTTSTSGSGDYLDSLDKFLNYAIDNNAVFVSTMDLVNMSIMGTHEVPAYRASQAINTSPSSSCSTCAESKATIAYGPATNATANFTLLAKKLEL